MTLLSQGHGNRTYAYGIGCFAASIFFSAQIFSGNLWAQNHSSGSDANRTEREIWVELNDMTALDTESVRTLKNEVEANIAAASVRVVWLSGGSAEKAGHYAQAFVMEELPGSLRSRLRAFGGGTPMALILGDSPVIYISRRQVAARVVGAVGLEPKPQMLGRALGRVLSHELAHRFVDMRHYRQGILKADLGQGDLTSGSASALGFLPEQLRKLQQIAYQVPGETAVLRATSSLSNSFAECRTSRRLLEDSKSIGWPMFTP